MHVPYGAFFINKEFEFEFVNMIENGLGYCKFCEALL
jgi:hypothetical protein